MSLNDLKLVPKRGSWEEISRAMTSSTPLKLGSTKKEETKDMDVSRHVGLPNRRKEGLKAVEAGKVSLANRWLL